MIAADIEKLTDAECDAIEAEISDDATVRVMTTPPGPLKIKTRLPYTNRPLSGPFEGDEELGR